MNQTGEQRERWRRLSDEVKSRLDYRTFYARFCHLSASNGGRARTHCPLPNHAHSGDGRPSLSIDLRNGLFHCFSRDEGGDAIKFYALMHALTPAQSLTRLARELNIDTNETREQSTSQRFLPIAERAAPDVEDVLESTINTNETDVGLAHAGKDANENFDVSEPLDESLLSEICETFLEACRLEDQIEGIAYLHRRGIDRVTMQRVGVAYFPRRAYGRIMRRLQERFALDALVSSGLFNSRAHLTFYRHRLLFPSYVESRAIYLQARTTAAGVEPRWHNLRGAVPSLYNVDALDDLPSGTTVYLVEGFTDTLTLLAHGYAAVGLVGAGGLKEEWLPPLARFRVVAALDPDAAGERATQSYVEMFDGRGINLARLSLQTDVNDFFRQHGADADARFTMLTQRALAEAGYET